MKYMFWTHNGKTLASLPMDVLGEGDRRWMTDELAKDFEIDANEIEITVRRV